MAVDTSSTQLGKMTVLELVELKNKIEEEWGITAAAPVAVAAAGAPAAVAAATRPRRRRRSTSSSPGRRPEDPGDQGRPRRHRPRPEGGEGPRRLGPEAGQGGRRPRKRPTRSRPSSKRPARASSSSSRQLGLAPVRRGRARDGGVLAPARRRTGLSGRLPLGAPAPLAGSRAALQFRPQYRRPAAASLAVG